MKSFLAPKQRKLLQLSHTLTQIFFPLHVDFSTDSWKSRILIILVLCYVFSLAAPSVLLYLGFQADISLPRDSIHNATAIRLYCGSGLLTPSQLPPIEPPTEAPLSDSPHAWAPQQPIREPLTYDGAPIVESLTPEVAEFIPGTQAENDRRFVASPLTSRFCDYTLSFSYCIRF